MKLLQAFVIGLSMYSKIPLPRVSWTKENMRYALCFFPVVGMITGLCIWGAGEILMRLSCGKLLFGVLMTLIPLIINGGIHMDGFMDTSDALASHQDQETKLKILKDPNCGAFSVIALCAYLLLSVALWSEVSITALPMIALGYVLSRSLSGLSVVFFKAARENGLAKTFQDNAQKKAVGISMCIFGVLAALGIIIISPIRGIIILALASISFLYYRIMSYRQFGGITGDLAGYFLQVCEISVLAGALWK
ncbi:adenosylcobinamide-GDP ribazoletransferase [Aequitasia blattaphilus]|uniref:Adenosylcobinamide-GDP ribazoletransferase n=1 Tax=Aequitasia blattaphilus TaxID=2949332 RepID=A0ABT1E8S3_9FIRM|nr:adenosylcobinamide-GDP ribazoletransferase [Aequitasia blattaphilus]MCP1102168.1 adenosylcobinamide-GDP ribazoletransferase [Aequitasia blattaphilus]MCR8614808.1 adenosylcobinamide-GDP ribazoletransferase [Aequitasia blattaphilus]